MNLDDKYRLESGAVYLTGIQALVRLPVEQMRRDRRSGLSTAAFISGYEGSPLGGYDLALERSRRLLEEHRIRFVPGLNEDLAATAVLGSQIHHVLGASRYDGVVGIWYGKGPGVDRSGDILRHANLAGTGRHSAALALAGDDHVSKSSTAPHQSDLSFYNFAIPVFYPGSIREILDYGLLAIALSRFSGAWVAMKMVTNVCDGGSTVELDPARPAIVVPEGYEKKSDARLIPPYTLALEHEVQYRRLEAAREFARANRVNREFGAERAWLGIATAGKPYYDLMQAIRDLGLRPEDLDSLGVRVAHYAMTFPLEPRFTREFARGLDKILVIEEKRSFLELQLRELLYGRPAQPVMVGKLDENGAPLLPATGELDADRIARVLAKLLERGGPVEPIGRRLEQIARIEARPRGSLAARSPTFCSGCPHNRSTLLLEGQIAGGGIGCHGMAPQLQHLSHAHPFLTQMGGEGAPWIGMAPFVERGHIFQNIGDGTYFHSGSLAVEACVAAGVNITFRILYNGVVAMTGGQEPAGALPVPELTRKLEAEGVRKTAVVTDDLAKYLELKLAPTAQLRHRDELPRILREMEKTPGVTAIIYDQACAAEKRRLRSRGKLEEPSLRVVIHEEVCEGCGDCARKSNCVSLYPVETGLGQKTRIHQASCNKDYSCLLGDCPSFLTVRLKPGTGLRRKRLPELPALALPEPRDQARAGDGYAILMPGIGGTGVVTVNALLATAAWIGGVSALTLDQTGLAQKGGAVVSSVILSEAPIEAAAKIGYGNAHLLLGFDLLGAASNENLKRADPERTVAVVNTAAIPTGEMVRGERSGLEIPAALEAINRVTRRGHNVFLDANRIAEGLFGSHLAANLLLLGTAYQAGLIPLSAGWIEDAIRLNGVEVEQNLRAFAWGRKYYLDGRAVEELLAPPSRPEPAGTLAERRARELELYQNRRYADEYRAFVKGVEASHPELAEPVAQYLHKLMAYKDEYEVARLLTKAAVEAEVRGMWEQVESIGYNLHPPILRALGWKRKLRLGPWFRWPLRGLAAIKCLRGTPLDMFGYARVRRQERALIGWYRELVTGLVEAAGPETTALAVEIAALPDQIRGYEEIKLSAIARVKALAAEKMAELRAAAVIGARS